MNIEEKIKEYDKYNFYSVQELRNMYLKSTYLHKRIDKNQKIVFLCAFGVSEDIASYIIDDIENVCS